MAIQFRCVGCSQPIEVDNEFAGRTAMCPYCRRVVTVPAESTLHEAAPAVARPADAAPGLPPTDYPPGLPPTDYPPRPAAPPSGFGERAGLPQLQAGGVPPLPPHVGVLPRGSERPHALAWVSLLSGLALIVLVVVSMRGLWTIAASEFPALATATAPAQFSQAEQRAMAERIGQRMAETPTFWVALLGAGVAWIVSVTAGVAALVKRAARNWPAWVGVVISGMFMLCTCGMFLLNAMSLGAR